MKYPFLENWSYITPLSLHNGHYKEVRMYGKWQNYPLKNHHCNSIYQDGPHHSFVKFVRQAVGDTFALKIEAQSGC